jgi:long-chain fatty acid transport protein
MSSFRTVILSAGILLLVGNQAMAAGSGGLRNETPHAGPFGKGSAFIGEANSSAAVYYNPAGMTQLKTAEISSGASFISPGIDFKSTSGQTTQARRETFLIPHMYAVVPIHNKLALGIGVGSYWGLGTEWATDSFSRYVATKSSLENKNVLITASYQVTEQWSLALSADNDDSKASMEKRLFQGLGNPDGNIQLKAKDNAWGYRIATLFKINSQHQVGLMYRSAIKHRYKGKLYADNLSDLGTVPYNTIFGGTGSYETHVTTKVTLPQSIAGGYSFKPNNKWTFNFDLEWFNWSTTKEELLSWDSETDPTRMAVLSALGRTPRNWHSSFSEAFGTEYAVNEQFRLRGGYYHHHRVIPQGTLQSSNPDSGSHGYTLGLGYDFNQHLTLDIGYS